MHIDTIRKFPYFLWIICLASVTTVKAQTVYEIGASKTFTTIQEAYDSIPFTLTDNYVLEIDTDYSSAAESFPVTLDTRNTGVSFTIVIHPKNTASGIEIAGDPGASTSLFVLDSINNLYFDGRPGGTGNTKEITIRNTRTIGAGPVFDFSNDCQYVYLQYLNIESETNPNLGGIINVGTGALTGNQSCTIENCTIRDLTVGGTASTPGIGIISNSGGVGTNQFISIKNNLFIDVYGASVATGPSAIIDIGVGNYSWTISNNHFFQTASHLSLDQDFSFISITSGGDHIINGNHFGGNAPFATGSKYIISSGTAQLKGVFLGPGVAGGETKIDSNVISNIGYTTTINASKPAFVGMVLEGATNYTIGSDANPNIIGSEIDSGSIVLTHNGSAPSAGFTGMLLNSSGEHNISFNTIGGITVNGSHNSANSDLINVVSGDTVYISSNQFGNDSINSISIINGGALQAVKNNSFGLFNCSFNVFKNIQHFGINTPLLLINNNGGSMNCTGNTFVNIFTSGRSTHKFIQHNVANDQAVIADNNFENILVTDTTAGNTVNIIEIVCNDSTLVEGNIIGSVNNNNINIAAGGLSSVISKSGTGALLCYNNRIREILHGTSTVGGRLEIVKVMDGNFESFANNIRGITSNSNNISDFALVGLKITSDSLSHQISDWNIRGLYLNHGLSIAGKVAGILLDNGSGQLNNNIIRNLRNDADDVNAEITGVRLGNGNTASWFVTNNIININNLANLNTLKIFGLVDVTSAGNLDIYHNTVLIGGSAVPMGSSSSIGFVRNGNNTTDLKNNVFQNTRTGSSTGNYAIRTVTGGTLTNDYNYLEVSEDLSKLGLLGGGDQSFANWQTNTGATNSITGTENFNFLGYADAGFAGANLGTNLLGIVDFDFLGDLRPATPWLGAYEGPAPVKYYVNDTIYNTNDTFTTTAGGIYNGTTITGLTPADPVTKVQDIIDNYTLNRGDTIFIDDGMYEGNIIVTDSDFGSQAGNIIFLGVNNSSSILNNTLANTLQIDSSAYISFGSLAFRNSSSTSTVATIFNGRYIYFNECSFEQNNVGNASSLVNVFGSGSINNPDSLIFHDSYFDHSGNGSGISTQGVSATFPNEDLFITDNYFVINDSSSFCIDIKTTENIEILRNQFTGAGNGISINGGTGSFIINNYFANTGKGLIHSGTSADDGSLLFNSFYSGEGCISFSNADAHQNWEIVNNSFFNYSTNSSDFIINALGTSNFVSIDYNNYYSPNGGGFVQFLGSTYNDLTTWQAVVHSNDAGKNGDESSFEQDPQYNNPSLGDLDLTGSSPLFYSGTDAFNIFEDINQNGRANPPSIGAFDINSSNPTGGGVAGGAAIYINDSTNVADIYTSNFGNDVTGNGTVLAPFFSLGTALSIANPGDTIYIDAGTYGDKGDTVFTDSLNLIGAGPGNTVFDGTIETGNKRFLTIWGNETYLEGISVLNYDVVGINGGAFSIDQLGLTTFFEVQIYGCTTDTAGGGIFLKQGSLVLDTVYIDSCTASTLGGGLYAQGGTNLNLFGSVFGLSGIGNEADNGGGLLFAGDTLMIIGSSFESNRAFNNGGAIVTAGVTEFTYLDSCQFDDNSAGLAGGAIYQLGRLFYIQNEVAFGNIGVGNTAAGGGGIFFDGDTMLMSESYFYSNIATDTSVFGGGGLFVDSGYVYLDSVIFVDDSATFAGGAIYGNSSSYIQIENETIIGDSLTGNIAEKGGGIYFIGDTLLLNGISMENNYATGSDAEGGALYAGNGSVEIYNSLFDSNISDDLGGGIFQSNINTQIFNSGLLNNNAFEGGGIYIENGQLFGDSIFVLGNSASADGGGIYAGLSSNINLYAQSTIGNSANGNTANNGGGIYFEGDTLIVSNSIIASNNAIGSKGGAGIYLESGVGIISNANINNNSSTSSSGGGIYLTNGSLSLDTTFVNGNTSNQNGGGIFVRSSDVVLTQTIIMSNSSTLAGGGIYCDSSTFLYVVSNSQIGDTATSNTAQTGGGIAFYGDSLIIQNSKIKGNLATTKGGGLYADSSFSYLKNNTIDGNDANLGGGIFGDTLSKIIIDTNNIIGTDSLGNSANSGGGIIFYGDTLIINSSAISGNIASDPSIAGGGLFLNHGFTSVNNSTISNNATTHGGTSANGGGIVIFDTAFVIIQRTLIENNYADNDGAGIYVFADSATLFNNIIVNNTAEDRAAIFIDSGNVAIYNSTIADNISNDPSGYSGGVETWTNGIVTSVNNIFYSNSNQDLHMGDGTEGTINVQYSIIGSGSAFNDLGNNSNLDPKFNDPTNGDYSLLDDASPAYNTGNNSAAPAEDYNGNTRILDGVVDLGAIEGAPPHPTKYYVNDGTLDGNDIYTTTPGDTLNGVSVTGTTPVDPANSIQDILDYYDLEPGDTIFVDAGTFNESVVVNSDDAGSSSGKVTIIGADPSFSIISDTNTVLLFDTVNYFMVADIQLVQTGDGNPNTAIFNSGNITIQGSILTNNNASNGSDVIIIGSTTGAFPSNNNNIYNSVITNDGSGNGILIQGSGLANRITNTQALGNVISTINNGSIGIKIEFGLQSFIYRNRISGGGIGISLDANESDFTDIINNFISVDGIGFENLGSAANSANGEMANNSFFTGQDCAFYAISDNHINWNVRNNIFFTSSNSASQSCLGISSVNAFDTCDYNIYYVPNGSNYGEINGTFYNTFSGWQGIDHSDEGALNGDENSISGNPLYTDTSLNNLSILSGSPAINNGTTLNFVNEDIDAKVRVGGTDIGASEYVGISPPIAVLDYDTTNEDIGSNIQVLLNDSDPNGNNFLIIKAGSVPGGNDNTAVQGGTLSINNNGTAADSTDDFIVYTPPLNFNGSDTFYYVIQDTGSLVDTASVFIEVLAVNDPPIAVDDADTTDEDVTFYIDVQANDSDVDNATFMTTITTNGSNGFGTVFGNDSISYDPDTNFNGIDTLEYQINDGSGGLDTGMVIIVVNPINDPPIAVDDADTTDEDVTFYIDVQSNDSDVDNATFMTTITTNGSNGFGTVFGNDSISYDPDTNFNGIDTLEYQINDGSGGLDTGMVIIVVNPINDPPIAVDDADTTDEDVTFYIDVQSNDSDVDNATFMTTITTNGANGFGSVFGNDSISYDPDTNFNGIDTLEYQINDGSGGLDTGMVIIVVNPINDPPIAVDDADTTDEDVTFYIDVQANDSDVDNATFMTTITTNGSNGFGTVFGNDSISYDPDTNFNGIDTLEYQINDGSGGLDTGMVIIVVNPINDPPIAVDDADTTDEDVTFYIDVQANDSDVDNATFMTTITTNGANGFGTVFGNDSISYDPDTNFNGIDTLEYQINDGSGGLDTGMVIIVVNPINDPPIAVDDADTTDEDVTFYIDVQSNDSDVDNATFMTTITTNGANGFGSVFGNDSISYDPDTNFNGIDTLEYQINDGSGGLDTGMVIIVVNPINDPPIAVDDADTTDEDVTFYIDVQANDSDVDNATFMTTITTNGSNGFGTVFGNDSISYDPDTNFNGIDTLEYQINDGSGGLDTGMVIIVVNPINDPPIAVDDADTTDEDVTFYIDVQSNDSDVDNATFMTTITTNGSNGFGTVFGNDSISYDPDTNFNGIDTLEYQINDGSGGLDTGMVIIVVNPINDPPIAVDDADTTDEDVTFYIDVQANDSDVDNATFMTTITTNGSNGFGTVFGNDSISYDPDTNFNGIDTLEYQINDGSGGLDTGMVIIVVNPINDPPIAVDDADTTDEDVTFYIDVQANDSDVDNATFMTTITTNGSNGFGTVFGNDSISYDPDTNFNGIDTLEYQINDGSGGLDTGMVIIVVNPINDPPVAVLNTATLNEDNALSIQVMMNDTDTEVELDTAGVMVTDSANNGSLTYDGAGSFFYTPDTNWNGTDTFWYSVCDTGSPVLCDTTFVIVTVNSINDQPIAVIDSYSTNLNMSVNMTVLLNDSDIEGDNFLITYTGFGGTSNSSSRGGTLSIDQNSTPADSTDDFIIYTPATNYFGFDTALYVITDPFGADDTATIIIEVINTNSITTSGLVSTEYCALDLMEVPFSITGVYNAGNKFYVELSDSSGSFGSPQRIDSLTSLIADTIDAIIPISINPGNNYKVRVVSSNPTIIGTDNGTALEINAKPVLSGFSGPVEVCESTSSVNYMVNSTAGSDYIWSLPPGASIAAGDSSANITADFASSGGELSVYEIDSNSCVSDSLKYNISLSLKPVTSSIIGDNNLCENSTDNSYSVISTPLSTYSWGNSSGTILPLGGSDSINLNVGITDVLLSVVETDSNTCAGDTVTLSISVDTIPTIDAGLDQMFCAGDSAFLNAIIGGSADSVFWQSSGDGSFNDTTIVNPFYVPGSGDIAANGVSLIARTNDPIGACPAILDTIDITISNIPTFTISKIQDPLSCGGADGIIEISGLIADTSYNLTYEKGGSITGPIPILTDGTGAYQLNGLESNAYDQFSLELNGCSFTDTLTVITLSDPNGSTINLNINHITCFGYKDGSIYAQVTPGAGPYSYAWSTGSTDSIITGLEHGSYSVTVTDNNSCTSSSSGVVIMPEKINPQIRVQGDTNIVCKGDTIILEIDKPFDTYNWSTGETTPTITKVVNTNQFYSVFVTDSNGCSEFSNALEVFVFDSTSQIAGKVMFNGLPVTLGKVKLIKKTVDLLGIPTITQVNETNIFPDGSYRFSSIPEGDYIVQAIGDTILYNNTTPTYNDSVIDWEQASEISINCKDTVSNVNIYLVEMPVVIGLGDISGSVVLADTKAPLSGETVNLIHFADSTLERSTTSKASGKYSMIDVPEGKYILYLDKPGFQLTNNFIINITSTDTIFSGYNFVIDTAENVVDTSGGNNNDSTINAIQTIQSNEYEFTEVNIYPNPFQNNTNISYTLNEPTAIEISVFDMFGKEIAKPVDEFQQVGNYNFELFSGLNKLSSGMYLVRIRSSNTEKWMKITEIE